MRYGLWTAALCAALGAAGYARADDDWASQVRAARASADAVLNGMQGTAQRLGKLLMAARARGDVTRTRCASEGLSRADVALRRARADVAEAFAAYAKHDTDAARRAMARFAADRDSSHAATNEVEACFSIERSSTDRTEVTLTIDPGIIATETRAGG
jgi:hypothetical protein